MNDTFQAVCAPDILRDAVWSEEAMEYRLHIKLPIDRRSTEAMQHGKWTNLGKLSDSKKRIQLRDVRELRIPLIMHVHFLALHFCLCLFSLQPEDKCNNKKRRIPPHTQRYKKFSAFVNSSNCI